MVRNFGILSRDLNDKTEANEAVAVPVLTGISFVGFYNKNYVNA